MIEMFCGEDFKTDHPLVRIFVLISVASCSFYSTFYSLIHFKILGFSNYYYYYYFFVSICLEIMIQKSEFECCMSQNFAG